VSYAITLSASNECSAKNGRNRIAWRIGDYFAHCPMNKHIRDQVFVAVSLIGSAISFAGCQGMDGAHKHIADQSDGPTDTLVVLCSRLFESRTYEQYLDQWSSDSLVFRFVDAGQLEASQWPNVLLGADGVLLTGGADLDPKLYGQAGDTILCGDIHPVRDSVEIRLLTWVDDTGLPCLGICRGLQHMNVFAGGTLDPHLPRKYGDMHRAGMQGNSRDTIHLATVVAVPHGIDVALQDESTVISHHHQGIDQLGQELMVWAIAPDGLAEGIAHRDSTRFPFYVGVQWHPERSEQHQFLVEPIGEGFVHAMLSNRDGSRLFSPK
jgi:putative glutamine amidotransferase